MRCQLTRGQAREYESRPSLESVRGSCLLSAVVDSLQIHQMARTKNVGGGPGDEDSRCPPRLPVDPKGKATKKVASKKRKYPDAETARVAAVAEAAEHAKRGGARSGVVIVDHLSPEAQGRLERIERLHGGPPGTIMMVG